MNKNLNNKFNIKIKQKKYFIIQNKYKKIYQTFNKNQKLNKNQELKHFLFYLKKLICSIKLIIKNNQIHFQNIKILQKI